MKERILCYYHGVDNDGYFSGALVKYFSLILNPEAEVILKPWTYSREEPKIEKLIGYDKLYLVDLHWSNELQYEVYKIYGDNFVWIDHHISSINEFYDWFYREENVPSNISYIDQDKKRPKSLNGLQSVIFAGCRNTWRYFRYHIKQNNKESKCKLITIAEQYQNQQDSFPLDFGLDDSDKKIPLWLYMISTYDAWQRSEDTIFWDKYLLNYEQWAKNRFKSADDAYSYIVEYIDNIKSADDVKNYNLTEVFNNIKEGKVLLDYQQDKDDRDAKIAGWSQIVVTDDDRELKVFLLNTQRRGSSIFKHIKDVKTYDLLIPFYRDKHKWNYSAYSFKEDIYIPSISFNGIFFKGHAKAAGCQSPEFLF